MPVVVEVKEEEEYNQWLAGKKAEAAEYASTIGKEWSFDELMTRGEEVYNRSCAACHMVDGTGMMVSSLLLKTVQLHWAPKRVT